MATIAVDFDGTIVTHEYPKIGTELPFATETLKMLIKDHHKLILWSVREGKLLDEAVEWCRERGVEFWAVNKDYPEESLENNNHFSRKLKADWFIDDRGIGGLPDWGEIYQIISQGKSYRTIIKETAGSVLSRLLHIIRREAGLLRHFLNDLRVIAGDVQLFRNLFANGASAAAKLAADGNHSVFHTFCTPSVCNSR